MKKNKPNKCDALKFWVGEMIFITALLFVYTMVEAVVAVVVPYGTASSLISCLIVFCGCMLALNRIEKCTKKKEEEKTAQIIAMLKKEANEERRGENEIQR